MDLIRWYPSTRTAYTYRPDGLCYMEAYAVSILKIRGRKGPRHPSGIIF